VTRLAKLPTDPLHCSDTDAQRRGNFAKSRPVFLHQGDLNGTFGPLFDLRKAALLALSSCSFLVRTCCGEVELEKQISLG
jgi:hypothetical protein